MLQYSSDTLTHLLRKPKQLLVITLAWNELWKLLNLDKYLLTIFIMKVLLFHENQTAKMDYIKNLCRRIS
jgi:hypothetical protein